MTQLNLLVRAYHRILKLARTIADLTGREEIQSVHLAEAREYRPKLKLGYLETFLKICKRPEYLPSQVLCFILVRLTSTGTQ